MSALRFPLIVLVLTLFACKPPPAAPAKDGPAAAAGAAPTNRVAIPSTVRQNLGITFARVERRNVARTLRLPGRFELLTTARREHRVPLAGTIELLVQPLQRVESGAVVFRVDSPRWREAQAQLAERLSEIQVARATIAGIGPQLEAHEQHKAELTRGIEVWNQRVVQLERLQASGGARADDLAQARASMATVRGEIAGLGAEVSEMRAKQGEAQARVEAAQSAFDNALALASSLSGLDAKRLVAEESGVPVWRSTSWIDVQAHTAGQVELTHTTNGAWVEAGALVVTTLQPELLTFRARGFQADLGRIADGMEGAIVPPARSSIRPSEPTTGTVRLAATADGERRTFDVLVHLTAVPAWARAGVWADLEVAVAGDGAAENAIPLACVVMDGTAALIFRRDPNDADKVIRMEADLGKDDGRWIAIRSGVRTGEEIVLDGVYQLMVATSGSITKGGHFHPDGTFHEGDD